ncbi:L-lactate dehydrogenase [Clostridium baratii]|uniref:L-lactate dehydrogenase n=1 Tax=Clostridium baratii str. Sullivan TaxID=1415775 RepID=A0A0A7FTL2_9CLOT|nr:L-lactate dehydrogenase [Clostridium baratii]AIY82888.1 L-lactate dehydrogenase [Clostridium baratii str. Sullivan]AQM61411.1 L-lactate dehydrogenase [Clostridium baratii]MBS6005792.1 L-lactate dehydrogenase [Clostridium baratii]MDU1052859.1 L-lactate dehydrogenase [Clostridium baratii]MDU4912123.1 L-lactate dehydrogenase [Clostridium baratii]
MISDSKRKVSIIGAGFVGATTAYALMNSGIATEICIYDINMDKAVGEVMDLVHGTSFVKPVNVYAGSLEETKDSDIVIITAGVGQKEGETRLDIIDKNYKIFQGFVPEIARLSPNSILLVVSNPVDVLTYITYKLSGFPKERVIGSGTVLDTSRLKYVLGKYFNVNNTNIHSYVIGEHGDSEVVTWSNGRVGGEDFDMYAKQLDLEWDNDIKKVIEEDVKNAAYEIISRKKATYFAVALAVNRIVEAIFRNENSILTVDSLFEGQYGIEDMYLAIPTIVNRGGAQEIIQISLADDELNRLKESATILKKHLNECNV